MLEINKLILSVLLLFILVFSISEGQLFAQIIDQKADVDALIVRAEGLIYDVDSMEVLLHKSVELSKIAGYDLGLAKSYFLLGEMYYGLLDNKRSLDYLQSAKELFEVSRDGEYLMVLHKTMGNVLRNMGEHKTGMQQYKIALRYAEELEIKEEILKIKNNIGIVHQEQSHYEEAIRYFNEALAMNPSMKAKVTILGNIGLTKQKQGHFDSASYYYEFGLNLAEQVQDSASVYVIVDYLTSLYWEEGRAQEALPFCLDLVNYSLSQGNEIALVHPYNMLGLIYNQLKSYQLADDYYQKSLELARKYELSNEVFILANMAINQAAYGNYKLAYDNMFVHSQMKDTLYSLDKNKQLEEVLAKYESEKKEKEIAMLQSEQLMQKANLEKHELIRNVAIVGSVCMSIVLISFIFVYAQKLKTSQLLAQKNDEINQQVIKDILKENEIKTIKASLAGQERERVRMAKELHDGVAGSLAAVKLNLRHVEDSKGLGLDLIISAVGDIYEEVRSLSHNLTPFKVMSAPFVALIQDYVHEIADATGVDFQLVTSQELNLNDMPVQFKVDLYRIIQELVANVVKHASAKSAEVSLTKNDREINLIVEDDGRGFDRSQKNKGIGLENIKHRLETLKGTMHIDSSVGRGTIVNIDLTVPVVA
ncbi:Tetratricopeptide repeat-containing protein [Reichenbachiella agariperforans]|uniref:histidine kinase n=1 Tax=Reichenbachiella agariperforans TaxID=156994 RepID=A0A1M6M6W7_REIAG|nr:tetratricopeptide repeat protein [Reichenbachiella agariperforans]SHJ79013.1 Tetratricopeptide repeat-containing protein [Reichenbachiella agariperforans]